MAFKATMPRGHAGIFMRKYIGGDKPILTYTGAILGGGTPLGPNLPIQELGVSVAHTVEDAGLLKGIENDASVEIRKNITDRFLRTLERGTE